MVAGDHVFSHLRMPYPSWYLQIRNNKIYAGVLLIFGLNILSNWMTSTGAFEVIYDGTIIFSGLNTGKLPAVHEIFKILKEIHRD